MPQKKNPDALELLRGKGGRVMGQLSGFMTTMKGLPSTYNKDMQEDKAPRHLSFCALPCVCSPVADSAGPSREEPLFHIVDTMQMTLPVASGVLATMSVVPARMEARLASEMLATDLAEYLVRKGVPFRQTHHIAGDAVKLAEDRRRAFPLLWIMTTRAVVGRGCELSSLSFEDLKPLHEAFEPDVSEVWNFERSAEMRDVIGGTSRRAVLEQVQKMRAWMAEPN